jgi:hypothetical protein
LRLSKQPAGELSGSGQGEIISNMAEPPKLPKKPDRKARLAEALKANLKRRKAQSRARKSEAQADPAKPR